MAQNKSFTFSFQPSVHEALRSYAEQLRADLSLQRLFVLVGISVEFALIVAAIRLSNIESQTFEMILTLALGGFLFHHFMPASLRQGFFAILSVASLPLVFGLENGAWLFAMGAILIALCHLPARLWVRVLLLLLAAAVMAAIRTQSLPQVSEYLPSTIWPILGSMFMFRLIIYLYDLEHGNVPRSPARALGYFFMLPNVCFPLFPVVDYKTMQRSAFNDDSLRLYQNGIKFMVRGLLHLALYKFIYLRGVIDPATVTTGIDVGRYMVTTFLLYLKVSGLFHFIVGLLHMYGYGLPATHHLYLLSSSFTDLWRRINIYWKEFIQKLVFNPAFFALRKLKLDNTWAIAVATLVAAVLTWFFHAYQWFWIRGEFSFLLVDVLFWSALGLCLTVNVILESRKGRARSLGKKAKTFREDAALCLKTAGMFSALMILWTFWNTSDPAEIGVLWRALLNSGPGDVALLVGVPIGLGVIRVLLEDRRRDVSGVGTRAGVAKTSFWPQAATTSVVAVAIIAASLNPTMLVPVSPDLARLVLDVRERTLNTSDTTKLQRGYYEDLGDVTRFNDELAVLYGGRPKDWNDASSQTRLRPDAIAYEHIPSTTDVFKGALRTINSHGMRDREYSIEPGPSTYRIALIGSSHDAGAGVGDEDSYENLVEDRLNRELGQQSGLKYEILNFSVGGYNPIQKLAVVEQKILQFKPDLVLYVAYSQEFDWIFNSIPHMVENRYLDQFPFVEHALEQAQIDVGIGTPLPHKIELDSRLAPFAAVAFRSVMDRFRDVVLSAGMRPAVVILETPDDKPVRDERFDSVVSVVKEAHLPVLDLQGSFASVEDRKSIWIAPWDSHSNATGHRLLANRLYSLLIEGRMVPVNAEGPR